MSQVEYIVFGTVGAVCFIIIVTTIPYCAAKTKRPSNTLDDDVQPYFISLPTKEDILENVNTE